MAQLQQNGYKMAKRSVRFASLKLIFDCADRGYGCVGGSGLADCDVAHSWGTLYM